jgi:hypothetical protein
MLRPDFTKQQPAGEKKRSAYGAPVSRAMLSRRVLFAR